MKYKILLFAFILSFLTVISCEQSDSGKEYGLQVSNLVKIDEPITITIGDSLSFRTNDNPESLIKKNIKITPKVDFSVEVMNSQTICLRPQKPLDYKTAYKLSLNIGKITGSGSDVRDIEIKTLSPILKYNDGTLTVCADKEDQYYLAGSIDINEPVDPKYIESGLSVDRKGCVITWTHSQDGKNHQYTIENIVPDNQSYQLVLKRNYTLFDDRENFEISYRVPAKGEICVVAAELINEPYHFEVVFSSMLESKQAFNDLVSVPGGGKVRFLAEGNKLLIYPGIKAQKSQKIIISKLIKNDKKRGLDEDWSKVFEIPSNIPSVKFINKGVILPSTNGMNIHFQSINFAKVEVRARRIYENNILQYLQNNSLNTTDSYISNVSRIILDTTIVLGDPASDKLKNVAIYGLNLTELINPQKGAIYKIEIRGREPIVEIDSEDYWESDYYFGTYSDYADRVTNILASDLGVIAKGSDSGKYTFAVTNLITTDPVSSANVKVYNDVNQLIGEGSTGSDGVVSIQLKDNPLTAIVSLGNDKTYVKLQNGNSLSLSNFEVGGTAVKGGQKGFIFGERGVWRPGDDIYITFISMSTESALPANHPVTAVLNNPQGQSVRTIVNNSGSDGLYTFKFATDINAPTGNWEVVVTAGGQKYTKQVKIETVKPNKLLINLSLNDKPIPANSIRGDMSVKWLVGNPASNLQTRVEVALKRGRTSFPKYNNYVFEDLSRSFTSETKELVKGMTDQNGDFNFNVALDKSREIPGFMNAVFTTRVFEKSGDFSIDSYQTLISPFETYIGMNVPEKENSWGEMYIDKNATHSVNLVALNASGAVALKQVPLRVEIYSMGWSWWWGSSYDGLASYSQDSYNKPLKILDISLKNGTGQFELDLQNEDSGFYFIRVVDRNGGHATSKVVMSSYSYDGSMGSGQTAAAKLATSLDKDTYKVGETANLTIPSALGSKAFVSIEKGESALKTFWIDCKGSSTTIPIALDASMTPNVYASITLIQPHNNKANDAPIRLFGVQRINVEDDATHLNPAIIIDDEIKPETDVTLTIKEKNSRAMSYVIAIVDEGLLSLTRYKTPNPWDAFYATEALGVRTWDLYDMVIGAYGARMEQLFAIGGDGESNLLTPNSKAERFKPVSIFMGPFTLKAKGSDKHTISIPQYIGNLRVMVIATNGKAQGSAEKNVAVKKPVMVQATMPRVIGTEEEMVVPVTVFTTQNNVGKVSVKIETNDYLTVMDGNTQDVTMNAVGEKLVYFRLKASANEGVGEVKTSAKCSSDSSQEDISIDVRNPNPQTTISQTVYLKENESKSMKMELIGKAGSTTAKVEASTLPPIDLDFRLKYLSGYPHGCIEQTISAVFPQLYLGKIKTLSNDEAQRNENNIKAAIAKLPLFAVSGGGFTYWPGTAAYSSVSFWGTAYAAHFMIEAKEKGYSIPSDLQKNTIKYLRDRIASKDFSTVERAYAAYVLSLSGDAPRGAMNKMREEIANMPNSAGWFLAAAYASDNKKDVARNIIDKISKRAEDVYNPFSYSFDSDERLLSTTILTYNKLGEQSKAFKSVETLSKMLNDRNHYMSTQSTAWALNAISDYCGNSAKGGVNVAFKADKHNISLSDDKSFVDADIPIDNSKSVAVEMTNKSGSPAYVILSSTGIPEKGEEIVHSNGLKMTITYTSSDGTAIDPSNLEQGTDFAINVFVLNTSTTVDYTNLVLSQIFPSGWEIRNDRSEYYYQDFRDDRVYSYFNLKRSSSISIKIRATAAYKGKYYLPSTICEAMYDASVNASSLGVWCVVR